MADQTTKDVELRIRASNYSRKAATEVVDDLKRMRDAQDAQIESAKAGATTAQQLEQAYLQIESAAKALLGQGSLIKLFQSQSATLTELEGKLNAARKAQQEYGAAASKTQAQQGMSYNEFRSKNLGEFTKAEGGHAAAMQRISKEWKEYKATLDAAGGSQAQSAAEAKRLAQAVGEAEKQLTRAQGRIETTQKRLAEFGITAATAGEQQQKIVAAVSAANAALERQEHAIDQTGAWSAQRKAAEEQLAMRQQQTRADNLFERAQRDLAASLQVERRAQQEANQAAAMRNVAHDAEMEMLFSNEQRKATEALNRKTAALNVQRAAMQAAADQAERMIRASSATTRGTAPVSTSSLAGQVRDIQNPSDAAVRSLDGIEAGVAKLESRVRQIRGPVKEYKTALEEATRVQKALLDMAGQVDAFQRQIAAVKAARAEYDASKRAVNALIAEMRSGSAGDDVTTRLTRAQGTLQQSAQRVGDLTTRLRQMGSELNAAGINTSNLGAAEQALADRANRATSAVNSLNDAFRRNGAAADESGRRIWHWFGSEGGRTTLSYMQRMRGELLGMIAGFVGLNAAIELGSKALDAYKNNQAVMSRLLIVTQGDARKAADEFQYLQDQADRIGFSFVKIAPAFAKFAIAAQGAGWSTQQIHFAFEQIAGAAVKAKLSVDDLDGVMKAFEQMLSKGTVQAEELRQQLGDRLPGAFQIAARAANMSVADYTKAMEQGKIGADQVLSIARELGKSYGAAREGAETLMMAQARFDNALNRFLTNTAKGGFVEAFQGLLNKLTKMMNDGQLDKFASELSKALGAVVDILAVVADNIDAIKLAVEVLIGLSFVRWLMSLPSLFRLLKVEIALANGQLIAFQGLLARQEAAAAMTTALGAGGLTGVVARLTPVLIACGNALLFIARAIPYVGAALVAYEATRLVVDSFDDKMRDKVAKQIDATTKMMKAAEQAQVEYEKTKGTRDEARFKVQADKFRDLAVKAVKDQQAAIDEAKKGGIVWDDLLNGKVADALGRQNRALSGADLPTVTATADPGDPSGAEQRKRELNKKLTSEDKKAERQSALARLKAEKGDLAERLAIIREPFDELKEHYRESTKDDIEYQEAVKKIDASYAKAAAVERQKYANEQAKQSETLAAKRARLAGEIKLDLEKLEAELANMEGKSDQTLPFEERLKRRTDAIATAYNDLMKKINREKAVDPQLGAANEVKLKALTQERTELEIINAHREEANKLVDEFNKKQGILNGNIAAIKSQVDAGLQDEAVAAELINEQIRNLGPGIEDAGQKALEFAAMASNMLDPTRFAEIVSTVRQGLAKNNVDAQTSVNTLVEGQRQLNALMAMQEREFEKIRLLRKLGAISAEEEVDAINATTAKYAGSIQYLSQELINFVAIVRSKGGMSADKLAEIEAAAQRVLDTSQKGIVLAQEWEKTLVNSIANNGVSAIDQMAQSIAKVITNQESVSEGFRGMLRAGAMFVANMLRDIALLIIRMQILKALQAMGGGIGAAAGAAMGAAGSHTGGVVGATPTFTRMVNPAVFYGAMRFHGGGLPGLRSNEVPTILEKGEEVLRRNDPRNVLNGGASRGDGGSGGDVSIRAVLVDDPARVPAAMASAAGEKAVMMHLKNNIPTVRQMLGK